MIINHFQKDRQDNWIAILNSQEKVRIRKVKEIANA